MSASTDVADRPTEMADVTMSPLSPFGVLVQSCVPKQDIRSIAGPSLRNLVERERLVVLRGFELLPRDELPAYCATLGEIYTWPMFGAVLDLIAQDVPTNYLFANGSVPLHWDGAFRESVPSLQFFQCVRAPLPGLGGETQFCDTTRVIQEASPEQRARWAQLSVTYTTEKVVHYGGRIHVRLLGVHPRTKRPTLRFGLPNDEDTSPQNPVFIQVAEMPPEEGEAFLRAMRELLYAPQYCYVHAWRDKDIVVADNHALLHGRRAFKAHSPRHLQRVHVQ